MSYEYRDSDGDQLEVYRLAGRAPIGVVSVSGAKAHVLADEAPFVALAVLEAAGIEEYSAGGAKNVADGGFTDDDLRRLARSYLEALRIRRAAEEAAKAEAEAEAASEQQELLELAEMLYETRLGGDVATSLSQLGATRAAWLDVARAAKEHFEGKES